MSHQTGKKRKDATGSGMTPNGDGGPAAVSSVLEPLETSEPTDCRLDCPTYGAIDHLPCPIALAEESSFRHSSWQPSRRRIFAAMQRLHMPHRRLMAFANCGSSLWLMRDGSDLSLASNKCRNRFCEACAREKRQYLIDGVFHAATKSTDPCRFITLTLRANSTPLRDQIKRLLASFKALRRQPIWASVTGGSWFLEVKVGERSNAWHPHLHIIAQGACWIEHKLLSEAWHAITGDSYIVDIRAIHDNARILNYVTKYVCKPASTTTLADPEKLDEFLVAMHAIRSHQLFGTWRAIKPDPVSLVKPVSVGPFDGLVSRALTGDPDALRWVTAAVRKWPHLAAAWPTVRCLPPPDAPPPVPD